MPRFITNIHVNKLCHLKDFDIPVNEDNAPHLILTGKNGSGKTITLNAIADFLDKVKNDTYLHFLKYQEWIKSSKEKLSRYEDGSYDYLKAQMSLKENQKLFDDLYGKVDMDFAGNYSFINDYQEGNFIIAFYQATRKSDIKELKNPTKPQLQEKTDTRMVMTNQLLYFLSDLKIQEALARNEQQIADADKIKSWFINFEGVLKDLFDDSNLKIDFNYRDYTFQIKTQGKSFKFTELSDGFSAIIDIIADLILKMQKKETLVMDYLKPGIVLIDEIETHLHLQLQKAVLPLLTNLFPNIQFIVTTHSPFVLCSLPNATAFDMEHHETITNLSDYSYQSLTESYFGVSTESDYSRKRFEELKSLLGKAELSYTERVVAKQILDDYRKIPEATAPELVGAYRQLEIEYSEKIKAIEE